MSGVAFVIGPSILTVDSQLQQTIGLINSAVLTYINFLQHQVQLEGTEDLHEASTRRLPLSTTITIIHRTHGVPLS